MTFSHLSYCVTSWLQASASVTKPLERLYNRALKLLDKRPIGSHHCHVLRDLNMLSFDNYIAFANSNLVWKCLNGQTAQASVTWCSHYRRSTKNPTAGNCKILHRKTSFGQMSLSIEGATTWNELPTGLKAEQKQHFKIKLKKILKDNQSCSHK